MAVQTNPNPGKILVPVTAALAAGALAATANAAVANPVPRKFLAPAPAAFLFAARAASEMLLLRLLRACHVWAGAACEAGGRPLLDCLG